ncbi:MAG: M42 family peptidase, partial [Chloroflexota bacterium]
MIIKELSEAMGVSGAENHVRRILKQAVAPYADEMWVDALGNLLVTQKGTGQTSMKVMLAAHMDEIGLMVTNIESNGTLRFKPVGGIDDRVVLGKTVKVGPDRIPGMIGGKPIHLLERSEEKSVVKMKKLFIDIGAKDKADAQTKIKIGDRAVFATKFLDLGSTYMGKAFDDRVGCAVLADVLENGPYPADLHVAFTVQEEVGLRGARVAGYSLQPDVAFVVEGTICDDLPKDEDVSPVTEVGKGPALSVMDRTTISDPRLVSFLANVATTNEIPYQFRRTAGGGTD